MKKILLTITCMCMWPLTAQITINPNPSSINSGVITITYGAQGDYSLFDPLGNPNLLLYTGLETDGVAATCDYHDDFANTATFVPFNFDTNLGAYVAQINVANRVYQVEPSLNVVSLPQGLQVNDFYFLIITPDLSRQSADLKGSDYGWQAVTLSVSDLTKPQYSVIAVGNTLHFSQAGVYDLETYDLSGRLVASRKNEPVNRIITMDYLPSNQLYISKATSHAGTVTVKHTVSF